MSNISVEATIKVNGVPYKNNGEGQWFSVTCPFHNGDSTDLDKSHGRVNPENGTYKCFSCGYSTNVYGWLSGITKQSTAALRAHVDNVLGNKSAIETGLVEQYHNLLCQNADYQAKLRSKHGITFDTIVAAKLGLNPTNNRITIPVHDGVDLVNIRQYSYDDPSNKVISIKGRGKNQLYHRSSLAEATTDIYIAEGEFKALLLVQYGFAAVAPTGGAGNWVADWNDLFKDKDVIIVYDVDKPGRKGAAHLCNVLYGKCRSIRNVLLTDVCDIENGDITDYFVKKGKTADDFRQLCIATECYEPPAAPVAEPEDFTVYAVPLAETSLAKHHNKRVQSKVVVSAKDTSPFIVPKKARVVCDADKEYCIYCHVSTNRNYEFSIDAASPRMLELINVTASKQIEVLKQASEVYPKCKASSFKVVESHNVEELRAIPQIETGHKTSEMVVRRVYYVGHGIETNATFNFRSRVCVEPGDQHATLIVYDAEPAVDDINSFALTEDLTVFQPAEWSVAGIEAKLNDIYEDLEVNVTKIYKRRDLHLFYDLVFHSALYIPFQGKLIKGWVDALCIGDSGQGKSECSSRLISHYRAGERVDTKRSSVAGLLGGLQETAGRWFITWGTIPLNDRRLVVLEEVKGMAPEALATLTDMRSSGIAEITKIERARTNARTRLAWVSNPRSDRKLSSYNYGVDAVKELIGALEDIRRFDMAIAVASGDVGLEVINQTDSDRSQCPHYYTEILCSHLVMWSWSRNESQVNILPDAEREILNVATRMGETYSSACPIVEPSDQRLKVLRLSVAIACRTFSTEDGISVIVRKCHVELVEKFLNRIYSSRALGYADFSIAQRGEAILRDVEAIKVALREVPNAGSTIQAMVETESINTQLIVDCTEWMKDRAAEFLGLLVRNQALRSMRRGGYRKTAAFIDLLKSMDRSNIVNETLRMKEARGEL